MKKLPVYYRTSNLCTRCGSYVNTKLHDTLVNTSNVVIDGLHTCFCNIHAQ